MKTLKINDNIYEIVDEKARNRIADLEENGVGGTVSEEDVRNAIETYMTENPIEIPSEYVTETELEEAMANVPTGSGGMSVSYDEEQEAIVFSGSTGGESGSGSSGDTWEEITTIELTEDTDVIEISQDKNGNSFSLKKVYIIFNPVYNSEKVTSSSFRIHYYNNDDRLGSVTTALSSTRTQSSLIYIDEVQVIASTHYDNETYQFDTYAIKTHHLSREGMNELITKLETSNYTHYAGSKITVWGVRA